MPLSFPIAAAVRVRARLPKMAAALALGWSAAAAAQAPAPWLDLERAVDDHPAQVRRKALSELATATDDSARRRANTALVAAAEALELTGGEPSPLALARAVMASPAMDGAWCIAAAAEPAFLQRSEGVDTARDAIDRSLRRAAGAHATWCEARLQFAKGHLLQRVGRLGDAAEQLQSALQTFERLGEPVRAAAALNELGWLACRTDDDAAAIQEGIARLRAGLAKLPDPAPRYLAATLEHNLGGVLLLAKDFAGARQHLDAAMRLTQSVDHIVGTAYIGRLQARLEQWTGKPGLALRHIDRAGAIFEREQVWDMVHTTRMLKIDVLLDMGRAADAAKVLDDTEPLRRRLGSAERDVVHWQRAVLVQSRLGRAQATADAAGAYGNALARREREARQRAMAEANARFQLERREAENRRLREQQEADSARQLWLAVSVLLLVLLVLVLLWHARRVHRDRQRLKQLAEVDELTGLPNRRAALERLRREMERAEVLGESLSVAICDIDHFKTVNDRFGHDVGDAVLRAFAAAGAKVMRGTDALGRIGGEEFLLVLPGTQPADARFTYERLANALKQVRVPGLPDGEVLTFSMGVAPWRPELAEADLLHEADQALYRAKQRGRARAELAEAAEPQAA